jgi:mannose-6-phosphate isomerase-like protein (cupin superfamily)
MLNINIEEDTKKNNNYREVLFTGNLQLVLMSLKPLQEIGMEMHDDADQFFRIESGTGQIEIGKNKTEMDRTEKITDGTALVIPKGTWHNIKNTSSTDDLKLYTVYSPPQHKDKLIQETKPLIDLDGGNRNKTKVYKIKF